MKNKENIWQWVGFVCGIISCLLIGKTMLGPLIIIQDTGVLARMLPILLGLISLITGIIMLVKKIGRKWLAIVNILLGLGFIIFLVLALFIAFAIQGI